MRPFISSHQSHSVGYIDPDGRFPSPYRVAPGSGNHWSDGITNSDWTLHKGSEMYQQAMSAGAVSIGRNQYIHSDGEYKLLSSRNGVLGFWDMRVWLSYDPFASRGVAIDTEETFRLVGDAQQEESWFDQHYYYEAGFSTSFGPQATLIPTPDGVAPFPYVRGGALGIKVNLGSWVLLKGQINSESGGQMVTTAPDNVYTQGLGVAIAGWSFDYTRTVAPNTASQNVVNMSGLGGLLGVEYDFTSKQLSVGMMPAASFALGFGVEGYIKQVLRFQF